MLRILPEGFRQPLENNARSRGIFCDFNEAPFETLCFVRDDLPAMQCVRLDRRLIFEPAAHRADSFAQST